MKNKLREMRNNKKGFTLIEMIVVIVIIAILVALAVPAVMGYVSDAREAKLKSAASAGATTITTAMAKSESLGKLSAEYKTIIDSGKTASGATLIALCTDKPVSESACAAFDPTSATKNSLNDVTQIYLEINDKGLLVPVSGSEGVKVLDNKITTSDQGTPVKNN